MPGKELFALGPVDPFYQQRAQETNEEYKDRLTRRFRRQAAEQSAQFIQAMGYELPDRILRDLQAENNDEAEDLPK